MHTSPLRSTQEKEDAGMIAIDTIEKSVRAISAHTFLAAWEIANLMKSIAYQSPIEIIPNAEVASAIQKILNMMTKLVDNTGLTAMEVRDLIITVC